MTALELLGAVGDFWRWNRYRLKEYVIQDGRRHPFALICPGALILAYPVITMGACTHQGSRKNLLGENPGSEQIRLASVEQQITSEYPPTFVWCGMADRTVDPANSKMFADALVSNRVPHLFRQYQGVDHGVGLGRGLTCESWFDEAVVFWERQRGVSGTEGIKTVWSGQKE